jgi:condensin-2 complex subunit H2
MATQGSDARYSHLLEPIRDLAQNWSIDIAGELEEYLGELESITISFDDGRTLNFAEAALLIQGSTCIYSKKVEHLYTLVYHVLNQVVEQKRNAKQAASIDEAGADADVAEITGGDDDAWLTLDDTLQEVDNISLAPQRGASDTSAFTLSRAPFLAPAASGGGGGSGEGELKMQSCMVHASGALLLPNFYLPPHILASLSPGDLALPPPADAIPMSVEQATRDFNTASGHMASGGHTGVGLHDGGGDGMGGGSHDDGDDDTWQPADPVDDPMGGDDWPPVGEVGSAFVGGTDGLAGGGEEPHHSAGGILAAAVITTSPSRRRGAAAAAEEESIGAAVSSDSGYEEVRACAADGAISPTSVEWDPWAPLDPHQPAAVALKPFRKGRTHSAAESAAAAAEVEASWMAEASKGARPSDAEKENNAVPRAGARPPNGGKAAPPSDLLAWLGLLPPGAAPGVVPLKQPLWEQFDTLHAAEAKRRAAARRRRRVELAQHTHLSTHTEAEPAEAEAGALRTLALGEGQAGLGSQGDGLMQEYNDAEAELAYDDDDVEPLGFDDDDSYEPVEHAEPDLAASALARSDRVLSSLGGAIGDAGFVEEEMGGIAPTSYEEMCRAHVESCLEAGSSYADDVALMRRVGEWQVRAA